MRYLNLITLSMIVWVSGVVMTPELFPERVGGSQTQTSAQEKAATLRSQLIEVEARQSELQTRLQKLEENLKAENIEHSLAGVGSTRPEDLREQRRRQLEIERNGVRAQLDLLTTSHSRLEAAISQADAEAYRQSAAPAIATTPAPAGVATRGPAAESTNEATAPARPHRRARRKKVRAKRANHIEDKLLLIRERVESSTLSGR